MARAAGVGQGTLYRNFATVESLLTEVYRTDVDRLVASAADLVERHDAVTALRQWLDLVAGYARINRGVLAALQPSSGNEVTARHTGSIGEAVEVLPLAGKEERSYAPTSTPRRSSSSSASCPGSTRRKQPSARRTYLTSSSAGSWPQVGCPTPSADRLRRAAAPGAGRPLLRQAERTCSRTTEIVSMVLSSRSGDRAVPVGRARRLRAPDRAEDRGGGVQLVLRACDVTTFRTQVGTSVGGLQPLLGGLLDSGMSEDWLFFRSWLLLTSGANVRNDVAHGLHEAPTAAYAALALLAARLVEAEPVVQKAMARAGLDPAPYSAHSLRDGFVTYAHPRGASDRTIAHQTKHRSLATLGACARVLGLTRFDGHPPRGEARVTTWLHRVVVNACLDRLRRRAARATVPLPTDGDDPASPRDDIADRIRGCAPERMSCM